MPNEMVRGDTGTLDDGDAESMFASDEDLADVFGEDGEVEDEPQAAPAGRRGTDVILSELEQSHPEAADLVRGMQRRMSSMTNTFNERSAELLDLREKLLARLDVQEGGAERSGEVGQPQAAAGPELPEGVTQEQMDMFRTMAKGLGFVHREELQQARQEQDAEGYVQSALRQGLDEFGDDFGFEDEEGHVVINPEVRERLSRRMKDLTNPKRGITPLDVYRLEFATAKRPQRAAAVEDNGRQRPPATPAASRMSPSRASVARRTSGGSEGSRVQIYDPSKNEDMDVVLDRAWAAGKRKLMSGRR